MQIKGTVFLKKGKEVSPIRKHPWVFSGAIDRTEGEINNGDWIELRSAQNTCLGFGHFQKGSISIRMLHFGSEAPDQFFWQTKIQQAIEVRNNVLLPKPSHTTAYRLIHAEGDGLPGLIVDMYDHVVVIQAHSFGMHQDRRLIADALIHVLGKNIACIYYKSKNTLHASTEEINDEYLMGKVEPPVEILENGHAFQVNWEEGQKTGFFLDQRDNRKLLGSYAEGKKVLNTFCYTGGFSVYALKAGATLVHSIDISAKAIAQARQNIVLNGFDADLHTCFTGESIEHIEKNANTYDIIILDPPAFAKHRDARHQAVKGYQRLNTTAMKSIKAGGIIFTFSCSQVVDRQLFYNTIVSSAIQAGRNVRVLHQLTQGADHPVSLFHPEGEYLKGLVLQVD
jgi:23S rRNA (cytosine1962-C5)-methyltransferase